MALPDALLGYQSHLWSPDQLDAIERKFPSREVKAYVAEIRRLNCIAARASDVLHNLDSCPKQAWDAINPTTRNLIDLLRELLEAPATRKPNGARR